MEETTVSSVTQCASPQVATEETTIEEPSSVKHGQEELALAFLVALTPLVVFTFLGQIGLL